MADMHAPPTRPVPHLARDLYCMRCGYNLRGLDGDPRRCPECAYDNPLEHLLISAADIKRQLRKLESAPSFCFVAHMFALIAVAVILFTKVPKFVSLPVLLLLLWAGQASAKRFAASCLHREGWRWALVRFHLLAAPMQILILAALFGTCLLPASILAPFPGFSRIGMFLGLILLEVIAVWSVLRLYRLIRTMLRDMQRDVAVAMYPRQHEPKADA
jgi:hypothetical protein